MRAAAWRCGLISLGLVLTLSASSAVAASSVRKSGCPVITRAQAAAVLGSVTKIVHNRQHTPGPGGGVTWLQDCTVHFRGGAVDIVFSGDDRASFDTDRRLLAGKGNVKIVRGLGRAAYLYLRNPNWGRELHVFHPSKVPPMPGVPPPPGLGVGAFAVLPVGLVRLPVPTLVVLARVVLRHPIRPLNR